MPSLIRRAVSAAAACGLAVIGAQLLGITPAAAHYNTVSGVAQCEQNGTYTVVWTVANAYAAEDETATVASKTPTASTVSPGSVNLAASGSPGSTATMTQTGIAGNSTTATLSVHGVWHPDNYTEDADGAVSLGGTCVSTNQHHATAPSAKNGACVNNTIVSPAVTIPHDSGVTYVLDSKTVGAGQHQVGAGKHTVSASSTTLTLTGTTQWTYTLKVAPGSCAENTRATPVTPSVTQSTCSGGTPTSPTLSLTHTRGIDYAVSTPGPYAAGQTVTVTAATHKGYVFGSLPAGWTKSNDRHASTSVTFHQAPAACSGTEGSNATNGGTTSGSPTGLANTGSQTGRMLAIGIGLLALGVACLVLGSGRRRFNA
jgi:hypothetical protein